MNTDHPTTTATATTRAFAEPTAACPHCDHPVGITHARCGACDFDLQPRLEIQGRDTPSTSPLLWWGLIPPVIAIAIIQITNGLSVGPMFVYQSWADAAFGLMFSLLIATIIVAGPLVLAGGLIANTSRMRRLTGRHRGVAVMSIPITLLACIPVLGVLFALLAWDRDPRLPEDRGAGHAACPCGYLLPNAWRDAGSRCPECGLVLDWRFVGDAWDRVLWLGGLVGGVGLVLLLPIGLGQLPVPEPSIPWLLVVCGFSGFFGVVLLARVRHGWTSPAWRRPRQAWLLAGILPFLAAALLGIF